MLVDIRLSLQKLSKKRGVFYSESDFQHALAWEIHNIYPHYVLRLEKRMDILDTPTYVDMLISYKGQSTVIELKYKTRELFAVVDNEVYWLKGQSAQDQGRYDFLKDVQRLEDITSRYKDTTGYAIILTNDSSYWKQPLSSNTVDASFRIHEGREIVGQLSWGTNASDSTKNGREKDIRLRNTYTAVWSDYSVLNEEEVKDGSYINFKLLCLKIE